MTTLSTHVLDLERGAPAAGLRIALFRGDQELAHGETNADGRIADLTASSPLQAGNYRLVFDAAGYFARQGRPQSFLQRVGIEFRVDPADRHYHVPLLLSAYACTSYRGS